MTKRSRVPVLVGLLALVLLVIASHIAAAVAFLLYDRLPDAVQRSDWIGYVLNVAAPLIGGVVCAVAVVALLIRCRQFEPTWKGHFARTFAWYLVAGWVQWIVLQNAGNSDFGLWSQIITWPRAALLGGAATDALATVWRASRRRSNVALQPTGELW